MIGKIVAYSLRNHLLVLVITGVLGFVGAISFLKLPIEAYPDIADTWVQVITQWPGHAAEEIERQITVPLETVLNGVPHHTALRSVSLFGLSSISIIFDEQTKPFDARMYVFEKLPQVPLPTGVTPTLAAMTSPVGQVLFYVLKSEKRSAMDLKEFEDWELEKRLREVPGVADVVSFGGLVKQFQVLISPLTLSNYGLSTAQVVGALANNNQNAGGGFIYHGDETYNIRGIGKADTPEDIGNIVVAQKGGTPVRVKHLGHVQIGAQQRLGKISMSERGADGKVIDRPDVVEGIVLARVGEGDETVLKSVHKKLKEIREKYLPKDLEITLILTARI